MVKAAVGLLFLILGTGSWALDPTPAPSPAAGDGPKSDKPQGPVLYGDGGGRIFKWEDGGKTWLTPEGTDMILGGVGEKELWGMALTGESVRFFTLELPKKKDAKDPGKDKADPKKKAAPPPVPKFDRGSYPAPDLADRVGLRLLLVYGALSGHPRYEIWEAGLKTAARAWDDGRVVYAAVLGPLAGWIVAGRSEDGAPWVEVSGKPVAPPGNWRGRLTVAAWVPEADPDKKADDPKATPDPKKPKAPPPVHPWASGWGAPGTEVPRALFWGPDGWSQPAPGTDGYSGAGGIYPILGLPGDKGTLTLAGWAADGITGAKTPWFWDGKAGAPAGSPADGQPVAFSLGGKGGAVLVVRHESSPWYSLEGGDSSVPLDGLGADDRVVALESAAPSSGP